MKADLQAINQDDFIVQEKVIGGDYCYLVYPKKQFYGWTKDLLHFRSAIYNKDGEAVSLSFKKFFNWGERTELTYTPFSFNANGGARAFEKKDGSTLIIDKYKGETIIRTRGTFDARCLSNGSEIDALLKKYPGIQKYLDQCETTSFSLVFEWVTPLNQIVIPFTEPDLFLLTAIYHADYKMMEQSDVDELAENLEVPRPQRYEFKSIKDMLNQVSTMKDFEGLCVYCNHDQDIRKVKTEWYLKMHNALTNEFSTLDKVIDFYFANGMPDTYDNFFELITKHQDHEVALYLRNDILKVVEGMKEVRKLHTLYQWYVEALRLKNLTRKEVAENVFATYGKTAKAGMIFNLYDGKALDAEAWKKLFYIVNQK